MAEREKHLKQIAKDLEGYLQDFCPCAEDGRYTDPSGEKCNDAFLMLQEALNDLNTGS